MIDNVLVKLKFTYVGCMISIECTFGSATFCNVFEIIDIHTHMI